MITKHTHNRILNTTGFYLQTTESKNYQRSHILDDSVTSFQNVTVENFIQNYIASKIKKIYNNSSGIEDSRTCYGAVKTTHLISSSNMTFELIQIKIFLKNFSSSGIKKKKRSNAPNREELF